MTEYIDLPKSVRDKMHAAYLDFMLNGGAELKLTDAEKDEMVALINEAAKKLQPKEQK